MISNQLSNVRARIRPARIVRSTSEASEEGGKVRPVAEVELNLELGHIDGNGVVDSSFNAAIAKLWPGVDEMTKLIAADEDRPGCDLSARGKLVDMTIDIDALPPEDRNGAKPVFHLERAVCASRPKLKVDEDGMEVLVLRFRSKFDKAALQTLITYIEADVWVTMVPSQVEM